MPQILLADHDFVNLAVLQDVILSAGYDVITASDGAEAYAICRTETVDFVLTDYDMPRMSGLALGEKIKGQIPFALMSGDDCQMLALAVGAVGFFKKPVKHKNLLECIAAHVRE
jgi:CheY-like chemotaxis protein